MSSYAEIFEPFVDLFTQSQVNTILLAWLPTKLEPYMTGIMAVDMFITTIISSGLSALFPALLYYIAAAGGRKQEKDSVTIQIEYYVVGTQGKLYTNVFYTSLCWIISQQTRNLNSGSFVMRPTSNDGEDDGAPPTNILPEKGQQISFKYKGKKFYVEFLMPRINNNNNNDDDDNNNNNNNNLKREPSIYLTSLNTSVNTVSEFLNEIVRSYLETQKTTKVRSRYERQHTWCNVQSLSSIRGLDSVALDESQEKLLKKELETFVNDKDFYERIGMPYRRGILLYGKPGTGKTSLINAISSQLSRDIYYINLKNIDDDDELNAAFTTVPANQIIVLEDVDAQSKIIHKRTKNSASSVRPSNKDDKVDDPPFSLSTFLGCLDGHILAEGNIIIMTTNHVEHLDPACIRPGRMDVRLNLGYCTHYQIKKMYKSVVEIPEAKFPQDILDKIPEKLLPPCEVMMTMILYREEIDLIPQKVYELVAICEDRKKKKKKESDKEEKIEMGEIIIFEEIEHIIGGTI